jgi:hypothetical protein
MSMQNPIHPDDERLAAYAGHEPDVLADASLREHLAECERCAGLVRELTELRSALAELPDLAPSRPLQLLPPVAEPAAGAGAWWRRLTAPALAAGAGLVLVGAVGFSGVLGGVAGGLAGGPTSASQEGDGRSESVASGEPGMLPSDSTDYAAETAEPVPGYDAGPPGDESARNAPVLNVDPDQLPWLVVMGSGGVLVGAALALRFAREPRAG